MHREANNGAADILVLDAGYPPAPRRDGGRNDPDDDDTTSSIVSGMVYRLVRWHAQGDAQVAKDTNARVINPPGSAL